MKRFFIISVLCIALASNSFIASAIEKIWPALIGAINGGEIDHVMALVPQYVHANEKTKGGKTVLEHALRAKQKEIVEYLVSTINLKDLINPLSHGELLDLIIPAIELGQLDIIQAIIPEKVNPEERSKGGRSLITIAQHNQQPQIEEYLQSFIRPGKTIKSESEEIKAKEQITFYYPDQDYYEFTNFYDSPITIGQVSWPTVEHFFQAQKYDDTTTQETIRNFKTPEEAYQYGRDPQRRKKMIPDWNIIKESVMHQGLLAKFSQHEDLKQLLLETGEAELIEASPRDGFWGWGPDHLGQNKLGKLLMQVRSELKKSN